MPFANAVGMALLISYLIFRFLVVCWFYQATRELSEDIIEDVSPPPWLH